MQKRVKKSVTSRFFFCYFECMIYFSDKSRKHLILSTKSIVFHIKILSKNNRTGIQSVKEQVMWLHPINCHLESLLTMDVTTQISQNVVPAT